MKDLVAYKLDTTTRCDLCGDDAAVHGLLLVNGDATPTPVYACEQCAIERDAENEFVVGSVRRIDNTKSNG